MILCKYLDFIPDEKVNDWTEDGVPLYSPDDAVRLLSTKEISYNDKRENTDNGIMRTQTLSIKIHNSVAAKTYLSVMRRRGVVKCYSPDDNFYIGSEDFPAVISYSSDGNYITISVTAKNPVI